MPGSGWPPFPQLAQVGFRKPLRREQQWYPEAPTATVHTPVDIHSLTQHFPHVMSKLPHPCWGVIHMPAPCLQHQCFSLETFRHLSSQGLSYLPLPQQLPLPLLLWGSPATTAARTSSPRSSQQAVPSASLHTLPPSQGLPSRVRAELRALLPTLVVAILEVKIFPEQSTPPHPQIGSPHNSSWR